MKHLLLLILSSLTAVVLTATADQQSNFDSSNNKRNKAKQEQFKDVHYVEGHYNPIVIIPGDGGSQLQAKLNKSSRIHHICHLNSDWYDLWLNVHLLTPYELDCTVDNMKLRYNISDRKTYNTVGVQIRPTNFGSLDSVDFLDIYKLPKTDYFDNIIKTLEKNNGYERNVDMVGAAFDFRKAPNELEDFFKNLTTLIENTYIKSNYRKVNLICHSMGCLNSLYLLNRKTENWKSVFIKRLITLAAPWDGSFKAISAMLFGDHLGIPFLNSKRLQELQSTFPSLMYLFPRTPSFSENETLVETMYANYTLKNLDQLFNATGLLSQREMWHDTRQIALNLSAPNVELWCLHGSGIPTPSKIVFDGPIDHGKYHEIDADGDGTVNLASLRACEAFASKQEKPVYRREFHSVNHINILRGSEPAEFISKHIIFLDQFKVVNQ